MNYQKIYDDLISRGLKRGLDKSIIKEYTEFHHIIPLCMGGPDIKENLVLLFADEHYLAHQLLVKINKRLKYSNTKEERIIYRDLALANKAMTMTSRKNNHSKNKLYKWTRKEWIDSISGDNNPMRNIVITDEHRKNISEAAKRRLANKENHPLFGTHHSQETKDKLSSKLKGRVPHNKGKNISEEQKLKVSEAQKKSRATCIHCGLTTNPGNIKRYHNDKCKHKVQK